VSRLTADEIQEITRIEGMEHINQALARGKGIILITAHLGNVDVLGQLPLTYGIPFTGAVEHTRPERLFQYTLRLRQSHGLRLIPSDGSMMGLLRALKRGEIIGLPCDLGIAASTREVNFFGSPARLPDGPVRLALRTGAPLIPGFGLRLPDDTFLARIEPPIQPPQTGDREADITTGVEMVVKVLERYISQHPDQWLMAKPIWPME